MAFISSHIHSWNGDDKGNFASHQLESQSLGQPGSLNDLTDAAFQSPTPHWSCPSTVVACSVQFSCSVVSESLWPHELQHARPPCPSPTPRVYPNSCSLSRGCRPTIFSFSCPQSFPASGSFPMSQLFASGGQSVGASASTWVLRMNIQGWFPLRLTGLTSLQSKGLSSLLQHHSWKAPILWCSAFFIVQLSHPYMTTEKP